MNTQDNNPDYTDALIDRALAELVGGETPPDLSERILTSTQANQSEPVILAEGTHAMSTITVKQPSRFKSWAILAASLACVATVVGLLLPARNAARRLSDHDNLAQLETSDLDRAQTSNSGDKDGDDLMMTVTPHIIIQEEEEERLGIADGESAGAKVSSDERLVRSLAALDASSPETAKEQRTEATRPSPYYLEDDVHVAPNGELAGRDRGFYSRLPEKSSSTGTKFGIRPSSESSSEPTPSNPADERNFDQPAEGKQLADLELDRPGLQQASEPMAGTPILSKVPHVKRKFRNLGEEEGATVTEGRESKLATTVESLARRPARGESLAFDVSGPNAPDFYADAGLWSKADPKVIAERRAWGLYKLSDQLGTGPGKSGDQYTRIYENPFITAKGENAVSTFSIDVDTASYANVRQFLQSGQLPPPDAVRIEELVNYFQYDYTPPTDDTPFAANMEIAACPWNPEHRLARIAIKGREIDRKVRPQSNLVFLIDVSGSMDEPNKLPLLIEGMKLLTRELGENDKVAIVVYASSEGTVLPSTRGDQQQTILNALDNLRAGGSTAGGSGINLAYQVAQENFIKGGVNRVILCTDGDFNVGVTSTAELERLAEEKAKQTGVFLTVLGFGRGNLNDAMMEAISGKGNGNYHYVDNLTEARKVLVEEMSGTLVTIAKDVKIQVEFNPAQVAGYRLIGYENRMLRTEDFNDDKKDAGEIGAGHTVTTLYEIIPPGKTVGIPSVDPLKYQPSSPSPQSSGERLDEGSSESREYGGRGVGGLEGQGNAVRSSVPAASDELLTLKLRYKLPDADTSTKLEFPITDKGGSFADASKDFQFATAVASFGMLLRNSEHRGNATFDAVLEIAQAAIGKDPHGYRGEFLELVRQSKQLIGDRSVPAAEPSTTEGP
jgi:secreted protein with Ig-like and vWFA domain